MSADPESLRVGWQRRLGVLNPPIRSPRRHRILYDAIRRRLRNKTETFLVVLEIASFILTALGENKWQFLLAACVLSLLAFVLNIVLYARRRTEQLAERSAGKTLMLVDIFFSLSQFVTTFIYFVLATKHVRVGFKESLLPLCFAFIRWWISSPPPVPGVTDSDPPTSQIMPIHEVTRSTTVDIHEGLNPSSSATQMPATDNETMVDDPLRNFNFTSSSSCDSSPATSTTVDIHGLLYHSSRAPHMSPTDNEARGDDPLPNFKVTGSSSCEPLSSMAASTTVGICEGPNPSVSATQILATDNDAKVDDPLPNFKVTSSSSYEPFSSLAASTIVGIHGGLDHLSPAPHMSPTGNEAKGDDPLPNFKVTGSSSCEPLSSTAASTTVDIHEGPKPSGSATQILATDDDAKVDDPLPNFKVTGSSSCEPLSSLATSTTADIHEGLNHSSPAPYVSPTDNEAKGDDPLPNFKVTGSSSCEPLPITAASTTVDIHEGPKPSGSAAQILATDDDAKVDDPLPNFKVTSSSSCEPLSHLAASTTVDIHGGLNHSSPAPYMSPFDNEAKGDDPLPNFKVAGSSSYETLSSPTVSTTVHVHEGSNHSTPATQLRPTGNEAKAGDPLLNFKVTNSSSFEPLHLSLDSFSSDPTSTASTTLDIHEELNQSSPATQMPQTDDEAKVDE